MSKIEDLLTELCPTGVSFKRIDEVCVRNSGLPLTAQQMREIHNSNGDVRIFAGGKTIADVMAADLDGRYMDGPGLIVKSRGIIDFEFWNGRFTHKNELWSYKPKSSQIDLKFLYFFLKTKVLEVQLVAKANSVKMPQIKVGDIDGMSIPVPPFEVQQEIVRILEKFTELEAELEAELESRKKQYLFYHKLLLGLETTDTKTKWTSIKDICSDKFWLMPATPKFESDGDVPYITSKNLKDGSIDFQSSKRISVSSYAEISKNRKIENDDILIGMIGTIGEVARVTTADGHFYGQNMYLLRLNQGLVDIDYFLQFLNSSEVRNQLSAVKHNSSQGYLKAEHVENLRLPLPNLLEQRQIASTLDTLKSLISDVSPGLPSEISARREQYEYYRNKLLTFKTLESV